MTKLSGQRENILTEPSDQEQKIMKTYCNQPCKVMMTADLIKFFSYHCHYVLLIMFLNT